VVNGRRCLHQFLDDLSYLDDHADHDGHVVDLTVRELNGVRETIGI
jgi:hypothetical protein